MSMVELNTHVAQRTVGMLVDSAEVYVEQFGLRYRTVHIDGAARVITQDMRNDRVNFHVVNGKVTKAYIG